MQKIHENNAETAATEEEFKRRLKKTFDEIDREIKLVLFTDRGADDVFAQAHSGGRQDLPTVDG